MQILHRADRQTFALQHRPLFDMQFEIGMRLEEAGLPVAGIADAGEFLPEHAAIGADSRQHRFGIDAAGVDQRAHHVGGIAYTLLIGERGDRDRARRRKVRCLERLDHLQPGKHAVAAVIDTCIDDGVDMRADEQRCLPGVFRALPDAEYVADQVDGDIEPGLPQPADEEVAALFVGVGGGQPDQPALAITANSTKFSDTAEQALCIDGDHAVASAGILPASTSAGLMPTSSA